MNEQDRSELERLKQRHARLEQDLSLLSGQLKILEQRLGQLAKGPSDAAAARAPGEAPKLKLQPTEKVPAAPTVAWTGRLPPPPVIPAAPTLAPASAQPSASAVPPSGAEPIPVPPRLRVAPAAARPTPTLMGTPGAEAVPPATPSPPAWRATQPPAQESSFEMRLGTYWLVRVGIVMLLTGLVFFGNYAYQNFVVRLGPLGKVALLYLASGLLLGAGAWWQRKAGKDTLKNYAQVLFAGGLAAVYFTTYAAHHLNHLRVIQSAGLDGVLLLGWAGFMVWIADRKKSEVLALFAILLAYYTSVITRVGMFTLYSNLVLTVAAVFFLLRNRWAALTLASSIATYSAYAFWRFFNAAEWHWASPGEGLWRGTFFLIAYWVVFTAAVFLSKDEKIAGENRAGFLTLNNGAFFTLFLLTMLQVRHGGFWKFSLIYGSVLLVAAVIARLLLAGEPLAANAYLIQGLLLVTVGFISKFAGLKLALILAAESVVLLMLGHQRKNRILLTAAYIAAGLAVGWGMDGLQQFDTHGLILGLALGGLMLANALLAHRQPSEAASTSTLLRPSTSYFTVLALVIWLVAACDNTARAHFPLALAIAAVPLTLSIYLLRIKELTVLSQGYVLLGQFAWLATFLFSNDPLPPWWNPLLLIGISLGLAHWWQKQTVLRLESQISLGWQAAYALAVVGILYVWLNPKVSAPSWLALTSLLAVGLTAYGVLTRAWFVAVWGQIFSVLSCWQFALQLFEGKPAWYLPLAPVAVLGLLSFSTVGWFAAKPEASERVRQPLLQIALVYRWAGLVMSIWWVCQYIPARERIWLLALLGLWVFLFAGWRRNSEALLFSAAYTATALALFWLPLLQAPTVYLPNLVVILLLLAQRQLARRLPERYPLEPGMHAAIIIIGGLSLWRFISLWILENNAQGFYLTAGWSAFALGLFSAGIGLRERVYRWLGLFVLGCSLGRVAIFDVWELETLYRVLSFMALGVVLLVLGFIYNKYQEKIKEWL